MLTARLCWRRSSVADAQGAELWGDALRQQIYLGDTDFVERMQALAEAPRKAARDTPKAQRITPAGALAQGV